MRSSSVSVKCKAEEEYDSKNTTWGMSYKRGMIQSGWPADDDKERTARSGNWLPSWMRPCGHFIMAKIKEIWELKVADCIGRRKI